MIWKKDLLFKTYYQFVLLFALQPTTYINIAFHCHSIQKAFIIMIHIHSDNGLQSENSVFKNLFSLRHLPIINLSNNYLLLRFKNMNFSPYDESVLPSSDVVCTTFG